MGKARVTARKDKVLRPLPARPARAARLDGICAGGLVLGAWALLNTFLSVSRYGLDQGVYFWFCNLAMWGVSWGMIRKNRGWILGFLAIACFTQTFWIADNLWRVATGRNLLGLVEFMYQPGNPLDEFLVSHYHFFIIPTGALALFFLKRGREISTSTVVTTNTVIFGASYFFFPKEQNINCIHAPCLAALEHWAGPVYSILFAGTVCAGCLFLKHWGGSLLDRINPTVAIQRRALTSYAVVVAAALVLTAFDLRVKLSIPSVRCTSQSPTATVSASCLFTLEEDPGVLALYYEVKNPLSQALNCSVFSTTNGTKERLLENLFIGPKEKHREKVLMRYPSVETQISLEASCESHSGRNAN